MKNCPICFQGFELNIQCITNCNHYFCIECLQKWIDRKRIDCPSCRQIIKEYKYNNINNKIIILQNEDIIQNYAYLEIKYKKLYNFFKYILLISFISLLIYVNYYNLLKNQYNLLQDEYNKCSNNISQINSGFVKTNIYINSQYKTCLIPYFFIRRC